MHVQTHYLYLHFINAKIPSGVCLLLSPPLLPSCLLFFLLLSVLPLLWSSPLSALNSSALYSLLPFAFPSKKKKNTRRIIKWINLLRPPTVVKYSHIYKPCSPLHFLTLMQIEKCSYILPFSRSFFDAEAAGGMLLTLFCREEFSDVPFEFFQFIFHTQGERGQFLRADMWHERPRQVGQIPVFSPSLSLYLSHTHTHTLARTHTQSHSCRVVNSESLPLSLSLTQNAH